MKINTFVEGPIDANNYLLVDEKSKDAVLIDCSSPREEFVNAVKNLNVNLKYILLTHGHFDHLLGVDKFKQEFPQVEIYVGKDDMEQVEMTPMAMQMFAGMSPVSIKTEMSFMSEENEFEVGDIHIKPIATPGHTQGAFCYLVNDVLFSGDTLFKHSVGRCDLPGGNLNNIVDSIKNKLFNLPDETVVFPGHGEDTTISYEKKYNEILNV